MNEQIEPFQAIATALQTVLQANVPGLKTVQIGWPDTRWSGVDHATPQGPPLPGLFLVQVSEVGKNYCSRFLRHKTTIGTGGAGQVYTEQLRLAIMLQMSLFTNTPQDRAAIGWAIKQFLTTNYRQPLADGEYTILKLHGDHQSAKGETNFYQRDLTFVASARVLDATAATMVTTLNPTYDISPTTQIN